MVEFRGRTAIRSSKRQQAEEKNSGIEKQSRRRRRVLITLALEVGSKPGPFQNQRLRSTSASRSFAMISCGVCRFLFIESSRPLGPLDSHISWYIWRGSGQSTFHDRCSLACELSRVPLVVVIQKRYPFAVGSENACISRSARPPILLVQILNPRTVGIEYIAGTIGRTIVDNDDLNWRKGLVQCAGNRLINPVRVVVRGYDSGDRKR